MPKCQVQEKNAPQFNLIAAVIITSKREELIKDEKIERICVLDTKMPQFACIIHLSSWLFVLV